MPELVINVSNIISPLCYTILRIEPYTACPYRCIYCYSRWYIRGGSEVVAPRRKAVDMFERVARHIYKKGVKPIPFRLSTLVDPFPSHEELNRVSERVLSIARKYMHPLIINTKSSAVLKVEGIRKGLEELLDKGLALLQLSLSTLDDSKSKALEPLAPSPSKRLLVLREFGLRGFPVAVRLSPYIPLYSPTNEEEVEFMLGLLKDAGVRHIIVESLRIEREVVEELIKRLGIQELSFEGYGIREVMGLKPLVRVSEGLRVSAYSTLHKHSVKMGIGFATCKEGLFRFHTTDDCCGAYMLKNYVLRVTLWDFYRVGVDVLKQKEDVKAYVNSVCRRFSRICGEDLGLYPRTISKPMKYHEKKLLKVLEKQEVLKLIAPDFAKSHDAL
jgi:DNA repair photolyase